MREHIKDTAHKGDTVGGVVEAVALGVPPGLGSHVHWDRKLDGRIAQAFAAGAMLTMLADAMMPEAFQHGGKTVGLFTALGFLLAAVLSIAA